MTHNIKKQEMNRRSFIRTLGGAGLSMGMLQGTTFTAGMMLARAAQAKSVPGIKRVICLYVPSGAPVRNGNNKWLPSNSLELESTSKPLESVKEHCIFFRNATIVDKNGAPTGGHQNSQKAFGGIGFSNTWDVEMERAIGANSPFPSLLLGVQSGNNTSSTLKNGREIIYQSDPVAAFNRVFGGSNAPQGNLGVQQAQSVMDVHKAELAALQRILGSAEKERLEEHVASIDKIKSRLNQQDSGGLSGICANPQWTSDYRFDRNNTNRFGEEARLQMDTAVMSLACNMTNVVSIMLGNHQSQQEFPDIPYKGNYHESIHNGKIAEYEQVRAYLSTHVAYLIEELRNAKDEFGNSLLDSTLVIQSSCMGDGRNHSSELAPLMIAGGGSALRGGSVVECHERHTNVFDTATEIFGLTGTLPQFGTGALSNVIV